MNVSRFLNSVARSIPRLCRRQGDPRATFAITALMICCVAQAVELEWQRGRSHDVEIGLDGTTLSIRTTGNDPYLVWRLPRPARPSEQVLEFEYFCADGIGSVTGYLGPPITEASRFNMPDLAVSQGWQSYRLDLANATGGPLKPSVSLLRIDPGTQPEARLQIRNLRLRERTPEEDAQAARAQQLRLEKQQADTVISTYLESTFPWSIREIRVTADQITLEAGQHGGQQTPPILRLIEYPAHHAITDAGLDSGLAFEASDDELHLQLPRRAEGRDRLTSGWRLQVVDNGKPRFVSARHFPKAITPRSTDVPVSRPVPKSAKGLSGMSHRGPLEELPELGIHAVTINLVLNRFLSFRSGPGLEPIDVPGPPVFFDPAPFTHYDQLIDFARQHDMVVSAIVLIPRSQNPASRSPLVHPESDGGVYAMPDLTTARGAALYTFVLDRIAERYRHPDRSPGGITNWIAHNEIDFHTVWTNMGRQPRRVLTETYYRSMRLIDLVARQHNPHARVFASLTHHWVVPDDGKWQQLSPRETLEWLQRLSKMEGEFPWGIAYHPYPQSLFAAVAWNDREAINDLQTPLITIQNLEVLGQFLQQPSMRDAAGNLRPVLLSEQGFHTQSYEAEDQARQAASLWYAMNKVRSLPWIETFHYHRWIDHPDEGGLLLGLRTLPDPQNRHGQPKRSWHVYRAIGTPQEQDAVDGLPTPQDNQQ